MTTLAQKLEWDAKKKIDKTNLLNIILYISFLIKAKVCPWGANKQLIIWSCLNANVEAKHAKESDSDLVCS